MNTKQLKLFLLVADLKSFSKTAELEALTQPAVTQQISRLEREVGTLLFRRKRKRIELTAKGKLFQKFAQNVLKMVDNIEKEFKTMDTEESSILRIGSSHIPVANILHRKIAEFKIKYPNSYIIYELNDTENIIDMVENGVIDIGFVGARQNDGLEYRSFLGDELLLVVQKDINTPASVSLAGLKKIPIILNQKEAGVRKFLENRLKNYNISFSDLNIVSEIGLPEAALNVVRAGIGGAFIPSTMLNNIDDRENFKVVKIRNFDASRDYYAVSKKHDSLSGIAVNFLEFFIS
jgi:DNA-binding transcriptional LysR family regulator